MLEDSPARVPGAVQDKKIPCGHIWCNLFSTRKVLLKNRVKLCEIKALLYHLSEIRLTCLKFFEFVVRSSYDGICMFDEFGQ
ncbi:hypothetical protein GCM10009087_31030 [Sphingomonas oligophenolica]